MKPTVLRYFLLSIAALALLSSVAALAAEAAMSVEVPPGQYRALRLRNLPKDVFVAVAIQVPDKLTTTLVSELDYRRYPKVEDPVFAGTVDKHLSFTVTIPQTGHYFLVFDNRQGASAQKVKFVVRAERKQAQQRNPQQSNPQQPAPSPPPPLPGGKRDQF
jgi:hypothetical protein